MIKVINVRVKGGGIARSCKKEIHNKSKEAEQEESKDSDGGKEKRFYIAEEDYYN